jgi:hypothetical protein
MRIRRSFVAMCGAAILMLAMSASGDAAASRTYVTFSAPVSLPGVTLGSGTYVFERAGVGQDLVRVTNRDNHIVYLTAFTKEVPRPTGMGLDTGIVFGESPSVTPRPIRAWFPENSLTGREFIYR